MGFKKALILILIFLLGIGVATGIALLLLNIQKHKLESTLYPSKVIEIGKDELDPKVWGMNYPRQYDSFKRTKEDKTRTL